VSLASLTLIAQQFRAPEPPGLMEFFSNIGLMGKSVFATLAVFSLVSWAIMVSKYLQLGRSGKQSRRFLGVFRNSRRFSEVSSVTARHSASPLVGLFQAGYVEIDAQVKAFREAKPDAKTYRIKSLQAVERSLRRALAVELDTLKRGTGFLATTAAACPFIGLFGTVWGIMVSFQDIATTGSTSIIAVAPGIAEALLNTAAGLAAAIPALIGYNYFGGRLRTSRSDMEDFILEFLNLTERNFT
jgi:biopolymer transport protein TolQ